MRYWHRFWAAFHRARADSWNRQLDLLYSRGRLSSWKQHYWEQRIHEERVKADQHRQSVFG